MPSLTQALQEEYARLFDTCVVRAEKAAEVNEAVKKIMKKRERYETVAQGTGVPWQVIAVIHGMEASFRFTTHLHNGDPLSARTVQVPKGRPKTGEAPFTWEFSAEDAIRLQKLDQWGRWDVPGTLYKLEAYNGWGYRSHHPEVLSPYLWSFTNHYTRGKYVADGTFSSTAVSKQVGAAAMLRRLAEVLAGDVVFDDAPPAAVGEAGDAAPMIRFSNSVTPHAEDLQRFLNTCPGIFVKVDGKPGRRTSDVAKRVLGRYLVGDPEGN